jgi:hypothetical protein
MFAKSNKKLSVDSMAYLLSDRSDVQIISVAPIFKEKDAILWRLYCFI